MAGGGDSPRRTLGGSPALSGKPRYTCETSCPATPPELMTVKETAMMSSKRVEDPPGEVPTTDDGFIHAEYWSEGVEEDSAETVREE